MKGFKRLVSFLMAVVLIVGAMLGYVSVDASADTMSELADDFCSFDLWGNRCVTGLSSGEYLFYHKLGYLQAEMMFYGDDENMFEGGYVEVSLNGVEYAEYEVTFQGVSSDDSFDICRYSARIRPTAGNITFEQGEYKIKVYDSDDKLVYMTTAHGLGITEVEPTSNHVSPFASLVEFAKFYNYDEFFVDFSLGCFDEELYRAFYRYTYLIIDPDTNEVEYASPELTGGFPYIECIFDTNEIGLDVNEEYLFVILDGADNIWGYGFTSQAEEEDIAQDNLEGIYNEYILGLTEEETTPDYTIPPYTDMDWTDRYSVEAFVTRNYELVLGRFPDETGLDNWTNAIMSLRNTGVHTAYGFFFSPEYINMNTTNEEFVTTLYNVFLERDPDPQGMANWIGQLESGASREQVFAGVANSREFFNLCTGYGITAGHYVQGVPLERQQNVNAFVARLYGIVLNRTGDYSGHEYWVRQLINNENTGAGVAYGFFFSDEISWVYDDSPEWYALDLYRVMLGRHPDQAGFNSWVNQLYNETDRMSVFRGFAYSQEFTNICAEYGITRGTI